MVLISVCFLCSVRKHRIWALFGRKMHMDTLAGKPGPSSRFTNFLHLLTWRDIIAWLVRKPCHHVGSSQKKSKKVVKRLEEPGFPAKGHSWGADFFLVKVAQNFFCRTKHKKRIGLIFCKNILMESLQKKFKTLQMWTFFLELFG